MREVISAYLCILDVPVVCTSCSTSLTLRFGVHLVDRIFIRSPNTAPCGPVHSIHSSIVFVVLDIHMICFNEACSVPISLQISSWFLIPDVISTSYSDTHFLWHDETKRQRSWWTERAVLPVACQSLKYAFFRCHWIMWSCTDLLSFYSNVFFISSIESILINCLWGRWSRRCCKPSVLYVTSYLTLNRVCLAYIYICEELISCCNLCVCRRGRVELVQCVPYLVRPGFAGAWEI